MAIPTLEMTSPVTLPYRHCPGARPLASSLFHIICPFGPSPPLTSSLTTFSLPPPSVQSHVSPISSDQPSHLPTLFSLPFFPSHFLNSFPSCPSPIHHHTPQLTFHPPSPPSHPSPLWGDFTPARAAAGRAAAASQPASSDRTRPPPSSPAASPGAPPASAS